MAADVTSLVGENSSSIRLRRVVRPVHDYGAHPAEGCHWLVGDGHHHPVGQCFLLAIADQFFQIEERPNDYAHADEHTTNKNDGEQERQSWAVYRPKRNGGLL